MAASSSMSGCVSKDVEHERKTKRKHMVAVVEPESESESNSEEDDSSSEDGSESSSEEESSPVKQQQQKIKDTEKPTEDGGESEAVLNSEEDNSSNKQKEQKSMVIAKTKEHEMKDESKSGYGEETKKDEMKDVSKSQSGEETKEDETKSGSKLESSEDESSEEEEEETTMEEDDTKKTIQSLNIQKGEDVSKQQLIEVQRPKEASNSRFPKKFSPEDEVKVLHELLCKGEKRGTMLFWRILKDSMQLSFPASETQLYEKTRRLKERYTNRLKNSEFSMNEQERKVFELSEKVWGEIENVKPRQVVKKAKKAKMEVDMENKRKYDQFEIAFSGKKDGEFPVAEALDMVPISKRAYLEKKWKDVFDLKMELYMRRIMAEYETLAAVRSSNIN